MATAFQQATVSEQDYLNHYAHSAAPRYELFNGELIAMVGTSRQHNLIAGKIYARLLNALDNTPCLPYMESVKVRCQHNFYYPDVVVDCHSDDDYFAQHPVLIVEVLSDSTREHDLTNKLRDYMELPSLEEYAILEQDFMRVIVYRRHDNWKATTYLSGSIVEFKSVDLHLPIEDIYQNVIVKKLKITNNV